MALAFQVSDGGVYVTSSNETEDVITMPGAAFGAHGDTLGLDAVGIVTPPSPQRTSKHYTPLVV